MSKDYHRADLHFHKKLSYRELREKFVEAESIGTHLTGYITFVDGFIQPMPAYERTFVVSSANPAYQKRGFSIFGSTIDGTVSDFRLDQIILSEGGGSRGVEIEACYL